MDLLPLVLTGLILFLGSGLQSTAGFGFGMFAIPLLMLLGREPYEAIGIVAVCALVQTVGGSWMLRRHIRWGQSLVMIVLASATLPVGVWLLDVLRDLGPARIRQIFGALILLALVAQWAWKVTPRAHLHAAWMVLANGLCGLMAGLAGMGGPPVVMWIMAQPWSNARSRVTLWMLFNGLAPIQVFFLTQRFGGGVLDAALEGLWLSPLVALGILPGFWIGHRLSQRHLRTLNYAILLVISLYAIVQPMV